MAVYNDPIAELLTRIRNAMHAEHRFLDCHASIMRVSILKLLKKHGFIEHFLVDDKNKKLRIFLKYNKERKSVIGGMKRISKPGCRKYVGYDSIPRVLGGIGVALLSTSKGVIDDEKAREEKVGGELLCYIW